MAQITKKNRTRKIS